MAHDYGHPCGDRRWLLRTTCKHRQPGTGAHFIGWRTGSSRNRESNGRLSREQSQGLIDAKVTVHRAYEYSGYTWIEPIETAKLIAVDVEFRNYNEGLDLDDVDIIDGHSNDNYGSDPHIVNLTFDGKLATDIDDSSWPENLGPLRVLLIYAFPKESKTIKLGYWGRDLTPQAIPISGNGPSLPTPKQNE